MTPLLRPVGPHPASVYWRRRAVVFGIVALVVVALVWLWPGGGSSPTSAPAPSSSSAAPAASGSPSPSASPSGSPSAAGPPCADADIKVTARVDTAKPVVGSDVTFTMAIQNVSTQPCSRPVGAADTSFTVTSGGYHVWSSDDCNPGGPQRTEVIPPGQEFALEAVWNGRITETGCPSGQPQAQPGTYEVKATDGTVSSTATRFILNKAG